MGAIDDLIQANERFASGTGEAGTAQLPPARKLAILTCMDARILPEEAFGIAEGDAHVIRNAGGLARDGLRSLVLSQRLLGTDAIAVIHHSDCGMLTFQNEDVHAKVKEDLGADSSEIDFMPFSDLEQSVRDDVEFLRSSPLIADGTEIRGFVYDVNSRRLSEIG
jgi:carbonic anhydrase